MAGLILDSQLHSLARHLVQVDHRVDINKEIAHLNKQYSFVPQEKFPAFNQELKTLYLFEKAREVKKLNTVGYAKFKLDKLTGNASLEQHDVLLATELTL